MPIATHNDHIIKTSTSDRKQPREVRHMPSVPAAAARASAAARAAASADTRSVSRPCNAHAQPRARTQLHVQPRPVRINMLRSPNRRPRRQSTRVARPAPPPFQRLSPRPRRIARVPAPDDAHSDVCPRARVLGEAQAAAAAPTCALALSAAATDAADAADAAASSARNAVSRAVPSRAAVTAAWHK